MAETWSDEYTLSMYKNNSEPNFSWSCKLKLKVKKENFQMFAISFVEKENKSLELFVSC